MRRSKVFSALILGKALVLGCPNQAVFAQESSIHFLGLPDELREIALIKNRIFEDINQDGRIDLLFTAKDNLFLSYQNADGSFSGFEVFTIPLQGALDFADIFPGGEREICVMHEQGISCFQKENGRWGTDPIPLVKMQTAYERQSVLDLAREYFAIDLENDGRPELMLWGREAHYFYRQDSSGSYRLNQAFLQETNLNLAVPGLKVYSNPLSWLVGGARRSLYHKEWPLSVRYLNWTKESVPDDFLIGDMNHDGKKDFVWIRRKEIKSQGKGVSTAYEYQIHFYDQDKKFALEPGQVIQDPHGAWLSPTCLDIDGDGDLDLLRYQIISEGNLIQRPRLRFELFLLTESSTYPESACQIWETSDYPLGASPLIDVNGDGFQDLVLIHSKTQGFSLGSIIKKYVEESINAEVRVLPFRPREGFSRMEMIRKKVNVSFMAGIPVSLEGDFNGDGLMDLLLVGGNRLKIYPLLKEKTNFSAKPWVEAEIPPHGMYEVVDLDRDHRSEIILYYPDRIGLLRFNQSPTNIKF